MVTQKQSIKGLSRDERTITRQFLVYLASPITGLSFQDSAAWYAEVEKRLPHYILPLKPLRGYEHLSGKGRIEPSYEHLHPLSTERGIMMRSKCEVTRADALLVNLLEAQSVSIGTVIEVAWAYQLGKPIIVVGKKDDTHVKHPMFAACASIIVPTLPLGIDTLIATLSVT